MKRLTPKMIDLDLDKVDGTVFSLVQMFSDQAKKQGWKDSLIRRVIGDALAKDYNYAKCVLNQYCQKQPSHEYC